MKMPMPPIQPRAFAAAAMFTPDDVRLFVTAFASGLIVFGTLLA